jgi:hypothetical protein
MSFSVLADLNWLAVVVATVAYFGLGALWFAPPVFGTAWQRAVGLDPDDLEPPGIKFYVGPLATCLVATVALAMLAGATGTDTIGEALVLALVTGVGLCGATLYVASISEPKPAPTAWFLIGGGYHLVGLALAAVILALWS